ncbi:MAG: PilW family protein, partial [Desulfobulbales bacterium]|nr:PilW family protein [Desulfobulbales bacterium]
ISTFYVKDNELRHNANLRIVADNIEDLQFEFLEDTDDDGDLGDQSWSATFGDPNLVGAIRVWVLAMSEVVNDYTNNETYNYAGNPAYEPNDNRYRYLASATVTLRN